MNLRRFTAAGIAHFRDVLAKLREDPTGELPLQLLGNNEFTRPVSPTIEVTPQHFSLRREAAEYFREVLKPLDDAEVGFDAGLWTWLTLFYFDEVCPSANGKRSVKNDYHYIYEPRNQRHIYRHLLSLGWRILSAAPTNNRLMLNAPIATLDRPTVEIMKRLYLMRIPCIFEVLDQLYWDSDRGRIRRGMVSQSKSTAGDLAHRFPARIRQLEMTYDLQSLNAEQLITLLGDEFSLSSKPAAVS